jgi:hypothetical protein
MYVVSGFVLALALYIPPGSRSAQTAIRTGYIAWEGTPRGYRRTETALDGSKTARRALPAQPYHGR